MGARLNERQAVLVIRASTLLNGFGDVLSDHERDLCQAISERFRRDGVETSITANEWPVIEESVGAMTAAREDRAAA